MKHRLEKRGSFGIVGRSVQVSNADNETIPTFWMKNANDPRFMERIMPHIGELGLMGVITDYNTETDGMTYYVAIEDTGAVASDFERLAIPAATWAVFEVRGPIPEALQTAWKNINEYGLSDAGLRRVWAPELEVYFPGDKSSPTYLSEIWIPVVDNE